MKKEKSPQGTPEVHREMRYEKKLRISSVLLSVLCGEILLCIAILVAYLLVFAP